MKRKFTLRKNGLLMTDFHPKVSLTQEQIARYVAAQAEIWGAKASIEEIVSAWLADGQGEFENQIYEEGKK